LDGVLRRDRYDMRRMEFLIIGALALAAVFFAYRAFDAGVTITYHEAEMESLRDSRKLLARIAVALANAPSRSETEVQSVMRSDFGELLIEREGDTLFVDQIGLRFAGGKLVEIWFMDEASLTPTKGTGAEGR
jgi:hypothetical protein